MQARALPRILLASLLFVPMVGVAQPRQQPAPPPVPPEGPEGEGEPEEEEPAEPEPGPAEPAPRLRAPMLEGGGEEEEEEEAEPEGEPELGPDEARERLLSVEEAEEAERQAAGAGTGGEPDLASFESRALPLFSVHGYFRTRMELFQNFHLGRREGALTDPHRPFPRPIESDEDLCGDSGEAQCDNATIAGANMRLRVEPQINVSDEVQVNARLDFLDNLVLGSTPEGLAIGPDGAERSGWVPLEVLAGTQVPPGDRNSFRDSLAVKHAWAQVRTSLGVLRFGRMGWDWGLGINNNGGNDLDANYGDVVDRILFATRIAGITIVPMWDFPAEGATSEAFTEYQGQPYDLGQLDDVNQYTLVLARKLDEQDFLERRQLGLATLQGGVQLVYRSQLLSSETRTEVGEDPDAVSLVRRDAVTFTPDVWIRFDYRKLRIEAEGIWTFGNIENIVPGERTSTEDYDVSQLAGAMQIEYRLLADKLALGFETGYASGDQNMEGMNPAAQTLVPTDPGEPGGRTLTSFRFDRNYYVDLILWRNLFGTVNSAYYLKPSISYDFINNTLGQLFGGRLDIIWSRASEFIQTRGNHGDLGVEFDLSLYYRSEDGVSREDGFVAGLQYGLLIPLAGMNNQDNEEATGEGVNLTNAQTIRAILGVVY